MAFTLPDLPYPHDALKPYMSAETLEFHHDKHHLAYVNNGNNALKGTEWEGKPLEEIVKGSFGKNPAVFNNADQHYNHIHFWKWMKPNASNKIPGELEKALKDSFGSIDKAKEDFIQGGVTQFGSGWSWLAVKDGKIQVMKTPNGENPLVHGAKPILGSCARDRRRRECRIVAARTRGVCLAWRSPQRRLHRQLRRRQHLRRGGQSQDPARCAR